MSLAESIDQAYTDDSSHSQKAKKLIGEERSDSELPLSEGEITTIQSSDATFSISLNENIEPEPIENAEFIDEEGEEEDSGGVLSALGGFFGGILDFIFPSMEAKAASDTMKVSYSGYVNYCGHRMGYKYISQSGDYENNLVYCMNINMSTTSGDVGFGKNVPAKITFCLVNGARKKGGTCHTQKYSAGDAQKDYFITSAAIHVLNGEVKLSYYDDGSAVFKNIKQMVEDARAIDKTAYNQLVDAGKTIRVVAKVRIEESYGRQWTPTVVSQQKITFLEKSVRLSASDMTKVVPGTIRQGELLVRKTDKENCCIQFLCRVFLATYRRPRVLI